MTTIIDETPQHRIHNNLNSSPTLFQFTLTHAELARKRGNVTGLKQTVNVKKKKLKKYLIK